MQPVQNYYLTPEKAWNTVTPPSTPPTPSELSPEKATRLYSEFLDAIETNLMDADEDAMNELKQRVAYFKGIADNQSLQANSESSPCPYDSFNRFDFHLVSAIEMMAYHETSPESARMRQALAPAISVRRNLLAEFNALDSQ